MAIERTLLIIKPNAVQDKNLGRVITLIEDTGLKVIASKMKHLSLDEGKEFYAVHKEKPFFDELTGFISSGVIMALVLEGEDAISLNRKVMGATNPKDADKGTIRDLYGESITKNTVHGSDAPETANIEIPFFFSEEELVSYS